MDARDIARFWKHVDRRGDDECWTWTGCRMSNGYGKLWRGGVGGRHYGAHRLAYEIHHGADPGELFVCHRCDNKICVNPHHLFLGTHADNMRDMSAKGRGNRTGAGKGQDHPQARLTEADVLAIRASSDTNVALARRYGVTRAAVRHIRIRMIWKHI